MSVRPFRPEDAPALAALSAACLRAEADFALNPLWESPAAWTPRPASPSTT